MAERQDGLQGVPTGFKDVDKLFNGLRGGDLIILAARPAVGKTSFAMNVATNAAKAGSTVALFSLEMSSIQITQRLLCAEAGMDLSRLRSGFLRSEDWEDLIRASTNLSNINLFIDDSPGLSIVELRTKARGELRNVTNGLIIVDYLQLMQPVIPHPNNRTQEVAEISRGLKVLAKELNVPILALSQLSRSVESRGDKRPMLSDLRESGSIEQDADIVMFIDRSTSETEAESDKRPDWGTAELIVAKHRNGATRDITLSFIPEYTKFGDYFDDSNY
jgi:replicative DNA helicase